MTRQTSQWIGFAVTALVLALGASGCGSSGGSSGATSSKGSSGGSTSKEQSAKQTVTKAPFCGKLDVAKVNTALHATAPLKLTQSLKPGQKFSYGKGMPPMVSNNWECDFSQVKMTHPSYSFSAGVSARPYTQSSYDGEVKGHRDSELRGRGVTCEPMAADDTLAKDGVRVTCHRTEKSSASSFSSGYTNVFLYGLVGDTKLSCAVFSSDDKNVEGLKAAAAQLCGDFHAAVS